MPNGSVASNIFTLNIKLKTYLHDMAPVVAMRLPQSMAISG